jgi:hypothetical protein
MLPTSAPANGATRAAKQPKSHARRPVYQVTFQRNREPRRNKRQISELSKKLKAAVVFFISGCLAWIAIAGTGFLIFVTLFTKVVGTVLPVILAHFP